MEQKIQQKIQLVLPIILRTVGPILLRSGIGAGAGGAGAGTAADDDTEDDEDDGVVSGDSKTRKTQGGGKVSISLPTFPPDEDDDEDDDEVDSSSASSSTTTTTTTTTATPPAPVSTTTETIDTPEVAPEVAPAATRTTRGIADTTLSTLSGLDDSTSYDIISRVDIRIQDNEFELPSSTTTPKGINIELATWSDTVLYESSSQTNEYDTIELTPPELIHSSTEEKKPNALYLPTSDNSNLVRRKKAIGN